MTVTPYPLCWPSGRARARILIPVAGGPSVARATLEIEEAVSALGQYSALRIEDMVLSSNFRLAARSEPADPGVAAYFSLCGEDYCLPSDRFETVGANLRAVAKILEGLRMVANFGGRALALELLSPLRLAASVAALPSPEFEA